MKMLDTDKAWLAGIVDGEGCLAFLRRTDCGKHHLEVRCDIKVAMACEETIRHIGQLAAQVVGPDRVRVFEERRKVPRARPLWRMEVNSKRAVCALLQTLLPFMRTKRLEAAVCLDYLERAIGVQKYRASDRDRLLAHLATGLRHGCGEARARAEVVLGQVIPSQAPAGSARAEGAGEGVETRSVSPNNNPTHERPAPLVQ